LDAAIQWLKKNNSWKLTRNGKTWDGRKIKPGDTFEYENGIKTEREVRCIDIQGHVHSSSIDQAWDWIATHQQWKFNRNGNRWNTRGLSPGDILEAQERISERNRSRFSHPQQTGTLPAPTHKEGKEGVRSDKSEEKDKIESEDSGHQWTMEDTQAIQTSGVTCVDIDEHSQTVSVDLAWEWVADHPEWKFFHNGKQWNKKSLKGGDRLVAQQRVSFRGKPYRKKTVSKTESNSEDDTPAPPVSNPWKGQGKLTPKGLPLVPPLPYSYGTPEVGCDEGGLKRWLEANRWFKIARNDELWDRNTIEPGDHFDYWEGMKTEREIRCKDPNCTATVRKDRAWQWLRGMRDMHITRNNLPWDGKTVEPGDHFEAKDRVHGGGMTKARDPCSAKNFNARMARRKRVAAIARELREKREAEVEFEDSVRQRSTSVVYDGHQFITSDFVDEDWNKQTARRFTRWVRSFSHLERPWQHLVDEDTGRNFAEIKGRSLYPLNPDEVFENGQLMLKKKHFKQMPWRGFRVSPIRPFLRKRSGCQHTVDEEKRFVSRVVRMLTKADARAKISLFEDDHQGIRVQPGWLGISSPRSHMGETPPRRCWWQLGGPQAFLSKAGLLKVGLDPLKVKNPAEIVE
jgi:hypothetical protein